VSAVEAGWWPAWAQAVPSESVTVTAGGPRRFTRPALGNWADLAAGLASARTALSGLTTDRVVAAFDEMSRRWTDSGFEHRRRAIHDIAAATGFSCESVAQSLDLEMGNYRADPLRRLILRELGSTEVLDEFVDDPLLAGRTRCMGPRLTVVSLSGNVPGLPALSIVRAVLARSAVVAKVAAGEPTFLAHLVRSMVDIEPAIADAVVVTYWGHNETSHRRAAIEHADAVIAYGGEEACAAIRRELTPSHRYVEHGHKISVGVVSAQYLRAEGSAEVAARIANDVSTFDQLACIAPQAYIVEGDPASVARFAPEVAAAMERYATRHPAAARDDELWATLRWAQLCDVWQESVDPLRSARSGRALSWQVVVDAGLDRVEASHRVVRLVPVTSLDGARALLAPYARYLQNVGLGVTESEAPAAMSWIAELGASRISSPGRMSSPSVIWRHDGLSCLAALVRWCDVEMHAPARAAMS